MTTPNRTPITPGDGDPRHGTTNGYTNLHCRCPQCRNAWTTRTRTKRSQTPTNPATPPAAAEHRTPTPPTEPTPPSTTQHDTPADPHAWPNLSPTQLAYLRQVGPRTVTNTEHGQ